jgi:outer membrane protein OmpA-like peptidoglycan-associated protein/opacity protein-like surface antigen
MNTKMKFFTGALALMLISTCVFSQNKTAVNNFTTPSEDLYKGWSLFLKLGVNQPFTDVNQYQFFRPIKFKNENRPAFQLGIQKMLTNIVGVQGYFQYGTLVGTSRKIGKKSAGKSENNAYLKSLGFAYPVYFKTPVTEFAIQGYFDFTNIGYSLLSARKGVTYKRKFAVYGTVGVGGVYFNSKVRGLNNDSLFNTYLHGVSGKTLETVIPVALGFKYRINRAWNIGVELPIHNVLSDKLDGVVYNGTGTWLRQGVYDKYITPNVGIYYNLLGKNENAENIEWANPFDQRIMDNNPNASVDLKDTDGDGVADVLDKEANTPNGCRVDGSGKAMDTDGDGVIDCKDRERLSPSGYTVDQYGVAQIPDTDGDGIADNTDWEVNSAAGCKVDNHGVCPVSTTIIPSSASNTGFNLPTVYFDLDKTIVKKEYMNDLQRTAMILYAHPAMKLDIIGNADKHHSDDYNDKLGMRRAKVVADILIKRYGIASDRLNLKSNGKRTLNTGVDELNRRVDISEAR